MAVCGNGMVEGGEECDDGNADNTDDCLDSCVTASCGDGFVLAGSEECDDGNADNTDACLDSCVNAACGDTFVQAGVEECDDANADNTDACTDLCMNAKCGDTFVQADVEECDDGNDSDLDECTNACKAPTCTDSIQSGVETDVDCGGADCGKCAIDAKCAGDVDCMSDACVMGTCQIFDSCKAIKAAKPNATSGQYTIDAGGNTPFLAYCDMETDGGGWTILWATSGGDNQQPATGNTEVLMGDPLMYQAYNFTRVRKVSLSALSTEGLVRRQSGNTWIKFDKPPFDNTLTMANKHAHFPVKFTANGGATADGFVGFANFQNNAGGDFNLSMVDGATGCGPNTVQGNDHHSNTYLHLNCNCARHYLYSYSSNLADGDGSYKVNTALGTWTATAACTSSEGGGLALYLAVR